MVAAGLAIEHLRPAEIRSFGVSFELTMLCCSCQLGWEPADFAEMASFVGACSRVTEGQGPMSLRRSEGCQASLAVKWLALSIVDSTKLAKLELVVGWEVLQAISRQKGEIGFGRTVVIGSE